jgi:tetratricopeptide (TPR) repeat protein
MKVELGDVNGRADIDKGRLIAESLNTDKGKFYEAKAYRHFGAIERRKRDWIEALNYNDKSLEKANEITDSQLKTEAIAAAHYARAFVFRGQNNYTSALEFLDKSITEFNKLTNGDKKRGKVCMANEAKARFLFYSKQNVSDDYHTISTAKDLFLEALTVAEDNSLRLEMIRCYIGLAEIHLHTSMYDKKKAKEYIEKAKNVKINCDDDEKRIRDIEKKLNHY